MRTSYPPFLPKPIVPPPENEVDPTRTTIPNHRKKPTSKRPWLVLDSTGQTQVMEAGKHALMRLTFLPARDLRILDPLLSYPSTILGRERAIVINLEHIKAIITAQEVFLLNFKDPSVGTFVEHLQRRVARHYQAVKSREGGANSEITDWTSLYDLDDSQSRPASPSKLSRSFPKMDEDSEKDEKQALDNRDGLKLLPFEFIALEACLEAACSCLDNEAKTLEQEAHPALDKLTSHISTLNLDRVRQIKSRLVAITGRVQKVRDELEQLLDDDEDMAEMYLTEKMLQRLENSTISSMNDEAGVEDGSDIDGTIPDDVYVEGDSQHIDNQQNHLFGASNVPGRDSHGTRTSTAHSAISKQLDVEELEMLLEAYFVQIDGTLNKLSTLREYVDDTEDYINIMLDDKQNHLLQMGVMLTTATLVVNAFVVVAGVFGMNITIDLFDPTGKRHGQKEFLFTIFGGTAGSIFLYVTAISWYKRKRLLD
ncbi:hypothetical protein DCAR_0101720 [Daucus carota subsp. sativus]|uniref:Magnesium transporter n=1 Tax=Daucus carota subsp. sativus TaxID=79200 RepID=A0AAF0W6I6_DAUCS|nr:PREDICTED: magnesium transporter MRS2-3-like [Daucus carota subsp. sativus]WOG82555.1 hypothetical protein DCAR_0101720 [Daucus carota subsp. sativus]